MSHVDQPEAIEQQRVIGALGVPMSSVRLRAALLAGSAPAAAYIDALVTRCAVEPDFFVRDMLTWALVQHDREAVIERLVPELRSEVAQARAQALHTLSKLGDARLWRHVSRELLTDPDDEVARAAWRTAAGLVPAGSREQLAEVLATQWGRGDRDVQLSLSQAMIALGEASVPAIERGIESEEQDVRWHALVTRQIMDNPEMAFDAALEAAKKAHALRNAPTLGE